MKIETKENLQEWQYDTVLTPEQKDEIKVTLSLVELENLVLCAGSREMPNSRFDVPDYNPDEIAASIAREVIGDILCDESLRQFLAE